MDPKKAKDILAGVEMAEAAHRREMEKLCDWTDVDDVNLWRRDEYRKRRRRLLERLTDNSRCRSCGRVSLKWRVNASQTEALCESCHMKRVLKKEPGRSEMTLGQVITDVEVTVVMGGLKEARVSAGMGLREFARRAGWDGPTQLRYEGGARIPMTRAWDVVRVLQELGVDVSHVKDVIMEHARDAIDDSHPGRLPGERLPGE